MLLLLPSILNMGWALMELKQYNEAEISHFRLEIPRTLSSDTTLHREYAFLPIIFLKGDYIKSLEYYKWQKSLTRR